MAERLGPEAVSALTSIIEAAPSSNTPLTRRYNVAGAIFLFKKYPDEALFCLLASAKLDPEQADVLNNIAVVLAKAGDYRRAETILLWLCRDPFRSYTPALINLAWICIETNRPQQAEQYLMRVDVLDPGRPDSLRLGARTAHASGDRSRAAVRVPEDVFQYPGIPEDVCTFVYVEGLTKAWQSCAQSSMAAGKLTFQGGYPLTPEVVEKLPPKAREALAQMGQVPGAPALPAAGGRVPSPAASRKQRYPTLGLYFSDGYAEWSDACDAVLKRHRLTAIQTEFTAVMNEASKTLVELAKRGAGAAATYAAWKPVIDRLVAAHAEFK